MQHTDKRRENSTLTNDITKSRLTNRGKKKKYIQHLEIVHIRTMKAKCAKNSPQLFNLSKHRRMQ